MQSNRLAPGHDFAALTAVGHHGGPADSARGWAGAYGLPTAGLAGRFLAAQAAIGCPLIACHTTAADLHGFGVVGDGQLHVTTPSGRSLRSTNEVIVHRRSPMLPVVERGGICLTDPAETAVDVARRVPELDVLAVLDAALSTGIPREHLLAVLESTSAVRGSNQVRQWLAHADSRAESAMESRTRCRLVEAHLPAPDLQVIVAVGTRSFRRIDLGWRRRRVGLEYDGQGFHATAGSMAADRVRHRQLRSAGWTVLYAGESDIVRSPAALMDRLRRLLG